jgi:hypothetical protein
MDAEFIGDRSNIDISAFLVKEMTHLERWQSGRLRLT